MARFVSDFVAWEVAILHMSRRRSFSADPELWFEKLRDLPGITMVPATGRILMASQMLPGRLHSDPADRVMIATARARDLTLVTRDRAILAYGEAGNVRVLAC